MFGWIQYGFEVKTQNISSKLVTFIEEVSLEQMYLRLNVNRISLPGVPRKYLLIVLVSLVSQGNIC